MYMDGGARPAPKASGTLPALQSGQAITIAFLAKFSSKMTISRPTAPSPHSPAGDFTSILQVSAC